MSKRKEFAVISWSEDGCSIRHLTQKELVEELNEPLREHEEFGEPLREIKILDHVPEGSSDYGWEQDGKPLKGAAEAIVIVRTNAVVVPRAKRIAFDWTLDGEPETATE